MKAWYQPWWVQLNSVSGVGCRCVEDESGRPAWTRAADGTPVHQCGYPSEAWLRSESNVLNLFKGGPQHNTLLETEALTRDSSVATWITSYRWTPDKVIGSLTGREARVWRYNEPAAQEAE